MRGDSVGLQDIDITQYESMFGVMKDVLGVLWDAVLCLLQGTCSFVVEATTLVGMETLEIYILVLASSRHSKGSMML